MPRWTKEDKKRVRAAIDHIAGKLTGGQADIARELGLESRAVVNNWRRRGSVPLDYHDYIMRKAAPDMQLTSAMLHPVARQISRINNARGFGAQPA